MLSKLVKMRLDNQFCRMNCQMFSCAFNSGERGGSGSSEMLLGTRKHLAPCHPAWSSSMMACAPGAMLAAVASRWSCMASLLQVGTTIAAPFPSAGHTAPNR
jgi:hypothetical protein